MASRKRARTSSTGGSSSSSSGSGTAAAPTITLSGGEACPTKQVALWRSGRLTDTTVEVDGRTFAAHRLVLAAACDYFERHYDHEHMRGADHPKLLEHVTAAAFEPLLAFLYEGACSFDETLLAPVLRAAHYLGVAPLEHAAAGALTERLSPSNALTAWTWGQELELPELAEAAKETALRGFDEVETIEEATFAQVQALVADERLTAKSEEAVFSAVARFAEAKQPAEADLLALLRNVRFALMSKEFLLGTVRSWPMLDSSAGQGMLFELMVPSAGPAQRPRQGFCGRFLYVMGGEADDGQRLSTVEIYDTPSNTWRAGADLPSPLSESAAAVLDGKIYVLGGCPASNTMFTFDTQTGTTWAAAAPMRTGREGAAAAVVGGRLYAIGGYAGVTLSSVEAFDPQTGAWAEMAPMPTGRYAAGAAVLDGKIYVAGGYCGDTLISTFEVYDPQTNTWATAPPMTTRRVYHGVAVLHGKIYAVGGDTGGSDPLRSAEVYDPQTNSWSAIAPMSSARAHLSLAKVGGRILAVGGRDGSGAIVASVEAYDPQQDRWEAAAPMAEARWVAAVVCV